MLCQQSLQEMYLLASRSECFAIPKDGMPSVRYSYIRLVQDEGSSILLSLQISLTFVSHLKRQTHFSITSINNVTTSRRPQLPLRGDAYPRLRAPPWRRHHGDPGNHAQDQARRLRQLVSTVISTRRASPVDHRRVKKRSLLAHHSAECVLQG